MRIMKNKFIVDYDNRTLKVLFQGEEFDFNLDDGDTGDFWHSFTTKNGTVKDINFYQEDENEKPCFAVYGVVKDPTNPTKGYLTINMDDEIVFTEYETVGTPSSYFDYVAPENMCPNCSNYAWKNSSGDMQCDNCGFDEGND